jgi:hypothetical protein
MTGWLVLKIPAKFKNPNVYTGTEEFGPAAADCFDVRLAPIRRPLLTSSLILINAMQHSCSIVCVGAG